MKLLIVSVITFFTLGANSLSILREDLPEVLPDFGKEESTLLVKDAENDAVSNALAESFEKNYTGKYEIVSPVKINSDKYMDLKKFRYQFIVIPKYSPGRTIDNERFPPSTDYSFGVTDRSVNLTYELNFWSYRFKKTMVKYIKRLEKLRIENGH